jgi:hypothetical protein
MREKGIERGRKVMSKRTEDMKECEKAEEGRSKGKGGR